MMDSQNNTCIEDVRTKPDIGLYGNNWNLRESYFVHSITAGSTRFFTQSNTSYTSYAKSLIAKIEKFRELKNGFDSYDSEAPSVSAIEKSISFIKLSDKKDLPLYFVAPGKSGDVLVEFNNKSGKVAELYFNQDGSIEQIHYDKEICMYEGTYDFNTLEKFLNS